MNLTVLQRTCWIGYSKYHILHHINRIGLHNTKYQIVTKLGKWDRLGLQYCTKTI